jgi:hypothetical protein
MVAAMVGAPTVASAATPSHPAPAPAMPHPRPAPDLGLRLAPPTGTVPAPLSPTPSVATTLAHTYTVDDLVSDLGDFDTGDGLCDNGVGSCTLRAAIEQADYVTGGTQINVPAGTVTLSGGYDLYASRDMVITGGYGGGTTTIDAAGNGRVFNIGGGSVELADLTITGGGSVWYGAGIYLGQGALTLANVVVTGNTASSDYQGYGGGIYAEGNTSLWLVNSTVKGNAAYSTVSGYEGYGGGLYLYSASAYLRDSTIGGPAEADGNTVGSADTTGYGGGLYSTGASVVAENVTFSHNHSSHLGAGIANNGSLTLDGGAVTGNAADGDVYRAGYGGGIYNGYSLAMTGTSVSGNSARGQYSYGGGIYGSGTVQLTDVDVTGNSAVMTESGYQTGGGGIAMGAGLEMVGGSIAGNTATFDASLDPTTAYTSAFGGGLLVGDGGTVLDGVTVTGNSALGLDGEGGYATGGGVGNGSSLTVRNGVISTNHASADTAYGGGVYSTGGSNESVTLEGVQVDTNTVTGVRYAGGAGVQLDGYSTLRGVSMDANAATTTAVTGGYVFGGAASLGNPATLDRVLVDHTTATTGDTGLVYGGAVYTSGPTTMTRVQVRNTTAVAGNGVSGAGIYVAAGMTLTSSAVTTNTGDVTTSGGIATGGGLFEEYGDGFSVNLVNVTIAGNSLTASGGGGAYAGGLYAGDNTHLTNVTLVGNNADTDEGGIWVDSYLTTMKNTIVSDNTSAGDANCEVTDYGTLASAGYNLEDANSCGFANVGDQVNTDPLLGPLQDNGGNTLTMAPSPTSPVIDAATMNGAPKTDQRGVARPQGPKPDIGAVELVAGAAPQITSADHVTFAVGTPGTFTVTTTGTPTPALSKASGTLPSGVLFTDNGDGTATIAGTPGTGTGGTYPIGITAVNGVSPNANQSFTLTVVAPLTITTTSLAGGTVGQAYSETLAATGGTTPYTWSVLSGKLPKGLKLSTAGSISGTPRASGSFTFTILVHDSSAPPLTATANFTITIAPRTH